jgi:ankyrin repeat protein
VYPEAIESPEQKGIFPFHFACMGPTDLDVIQYLRSIYPASISMSVGGLYPLHFACANGALPKVIEYLIHESKGALYVRIACGLIPLHFACNNQASPEVLVTLIQAWPDSISVENKQGRTLLEFSIK